MLRCGWAEWAQVDLHGQQVDEALEVLDAHLKRLGELCHPGGVLLQARMASMELTCGCHAVISLEQCCKAQPACDWQNPELDRYVLESAGREPAKACKKASVVMVHDKDAAEGLLPIYLKTCQPHRRKPSGPALDMLPIVRECMGKRLQVMMRVVRRSMVGILVLRPAVKRVVLSPEDTFPLLHSHSRHSSHCSC